MILKRVLIGIFLFFLALILVFFIAIWPVDKRLNGKFISDREQTIAYLKRNSEMTNERLKKLEKIYGKMVVTFDGHKAKWEMPFYDGKDQNEDNSEIEMIGGEDYFFTVSKDTYTIAIILPKPIWDINSFETCIIEFDHDGYWVNSHIFGIKIKEKFRKIH